MHITQVSQLEAELERLFPPQTPLPVVERREGIFLQTLNIGCGVALLLIFLLFGLLWIP